MACSWRLWVLALLPIQTMHGLQLLQLRSGSVEVYMPSRQQREGMVRASMRRVIHEPSVNQTAPPSWSCWSACPTCWWGTKCCPRSWAAQ